MFVCGGTFYRYYRRKILWKWASDQNENIVFLKYDPPFNFPKSSVNPKYKTVSTQQPMLSPSSLRPWVTTVHCDSGADLCSTYSGQLWVSIRCRSIHHMLRQDKSCHPTCSSPRPGSKYKLIRLYQT